MFKSVTTIVKRPNKSHSKIRTFPRKRPKAAEAWEGKWRPSTCNMASILFFPIHKSQHDQTGWSHKNDWTVWLLPFCFKVVTRNRWRGSPLSEQFQVPMSGQCRSSRNDSHYTNFGVHCESNLTDCNTNNCERWLFVLVTCAVCSWLLVQPHSNAERHPFHVHWTDSWLNEKHETTLLCEWLLLSFRLFVFGQGAAMVKWWAA